MPYYLQVHMTYEDKKPVVPGMGIGRKLMDRLYQTYSSEFVGTKFAYDGEKALYTVGPLPLHKLNFTVVLEESFSRPQYGFTVPFPSLGHQKSFLFNSFALSKLTLFFF